MRGSSSTFQLSRPIQSPTNIGGAYKAEGFNRPSCAGEEQRERERESERERERESEGRSYQGIVVVGADPTVTTNIDRHESNARLLS